MEPTADSPAPPNGMPIYEDTQSRSIVDSLEEDSDSEDWYPGNNMAMKLWQCLEALRDIELALESAAVQKNAMKRKRQLKLFSVQLHSFASAVVRLCDQIVGDPDAQRWLEPGTTKQISKVKAEFLDLVPIDHKSDLSVLRNRMGGHIDRDLSPWAAREILSRQVLSSFGQWLHVCIHALLDLMKLDVYSWSVRGPADGYIRLMTNEPFLLTIQVDGEQKRIAAFHLAKRSPREVVVDAVDKVIKNSQWMFQAGEPRIGFLKVDRKNKWNTFTGSSVIWRSGQKGPGEP